jgi:hypothetical protein
MKFNSLAPIPRSLHNPGSSDIGDFFHYSKLTKTSSVLVIIRKRVQKRSVLIHDVCNIS